MESVFDRLTKELSDAERRAMLRRIEGEQEAQMEPLRLDDAESQEPVLLEREFHELSLFARLRILLIGFFTGRGRQVVTGAFLVQRLQRSVERSTSGMVDFRRRLVSGELHQQVNRLQVAMAIFQKPLLRVLEGDKAMFYALLGELELEEVHRQLDEGIDPEVLSQAKPSAVPLEIRREMDELMEQALNGIPEDRRRMMSGHTEVLSQMGALARFPFKKILDAFPPGKDGAGAASLRMVRDPLMDLGNLLRGFRHPPSATFLEGLFLYDIQDSIPPDNQHLEAEIKDRMERASTALGVVRTLNARIPWGPLLKALSEDIQYLPSPQSGGGDWFRIYQKFWEERLARRYRLWSDRKKMEEMERSLIVLWGKERVLSVPNYRHEDFPGELFPRHALSFAAVRVLFLDVFPGRLYHALNLVMIDGKFYKKDNRQEYDRVFGRFMKCPDKVRAFEVRLRPDGEFGARMTELQRTASSGESKGLAIRDLVARMDREAQNMIVPIIEDLKAMSRLLRGILDGQGGAYDTLSNMSEIGGKGHDAFRISLQDARNVVDRSAGIIADIMDLEDKRALP
ncbi:MAG: DUF5312 domain-containing protein [Spirochaetales bacterium]|nr:DUF5312 domain-containing protein [Spirochaetales bacterium]